MPKKYRLSHAEFARVSRSRGSRVHGKYFSLLVAPLPEGKSVKFACVVSKKISRKAVERNRVERRAREAARPLLKKMSSPSALILYPKRDTVGATSAEIARDIATLFSRV